MKISRWYYVSLGIVYFFLLGPFLIIFAASFGAESTLSFPPRGFSLDWFANIFANDNFIRSFWTSLQLGLLSTFLSLLFGVPVAYALTHFDFKGAGLVETLFSLPILVPGLVIGLAMLNFFVLFGKFDMMMGLMAGHTAILFPYSVRVVSVALRNLDPAVEEAAVNLGANRLRTFLLIVLPNIRAGIAAAFILGFITSFNNVPVSVYLSAPGVNTLPIAMLSYMEYYFDPTIAALSTLLILFSLLLVQAAERVLGLSQFV
ncbi:MAG: spermidine/putrescine ABC transporter ATP-binding protein [Anaerolineaceae bacterium]|nr:spermidine/putrescine ABC transporter ATP-binding protein [Anaerolineaceae bacterium]